ncbi:hypothetical protein FGO68_gene13234 [Halteria grandinella]|uniref:Uncharacterized protein n=1 Tax=Halteria grandinella TaxID=5974 RepID=A0A8J8NF78_HALGN|nr:hypothetical protein FGO68_gene13234 [Halteria grandinella]
MVSSCQIIRQTVQQYLDLLILIGRLWHSRKMIFSRQQPHQNFGGIYRTKILTQANSRAMAIRSVSAWVRFKTQ